SPFARRNYRLSPSGRVRRPSGYALLRRLPRSPVLRFADRETCGQRPTRNEALDKMAAALDEFTIEGVKTTVPFHRRVMQNPIFRSGDYDTSFVEKHYYRD